MTMLTSPCMSTVLPTAMASLLTHGASLSPGAQATLRAVLRDDETPLRAVSPVLEEWKCLDPEQKDWNSVSALAPLLVWLCMAEPEGIDVGRVFEKWSDHKEPRLARNSVAAMGGLMNALVSCLTQVADLPLSSRQNEALAACVACAFEAGQSALPREEFQATTDRDNADRTQLLLGLLALVHTRAIRQWSGEDLLASVDALAAKVWGMMANHEAAACAHGMLDIDMPDETKLTLANTFRPWVWTTHSLDQRLLPLLPQEPGARAHLLPWVGQTAMQPFDKNTALARVRTNRMLAAHYLPELHELMFLADPTFGAWRSRERVLSLARMCSSQASRAPTLELPAGMEVTA